MEQEQSDELNTKVIFSKFVHLYIILWIFIHLLRSFRLLFIEIMLGYLQSNWFI